MTSSPSVTSLPSAAAPAAANWQAVSSLAPSLQLATTPGWHVARRLCPAPTLALVQDIDAHGIAAWMTTQLAPSSIPDPVWDSIVKQHYSWLTLDYPSLRAATGGRPWLGGPALGQALVHRPVFTNRVVLESMVTLWGDHFHIPWRGKAADQVISFDRDVLTRHALGRFADLLKAAVTSPAMLINLDNVENRSWHPDENLGRELLELYTVGVGQYSEDDVRASSRILTGLGVNRDAGTTVFDGAQHTWGPQSVMTFRHDNPQRSVAPGGLPEVVPAYLDYLARHPMTARRVALKIAVRFVSDSPSERLVQRMAAAYLQSDTAIAPVLKAMLTDDEFWGSIGAKFARPREVVARARRAHAPTGYTPPSPLQANPWDLGATISWIETTGDLPRDWALVDGAPDVRTAWDSPNTLGATWNAVAGVAYHWDQQTSAPDWGRSLGVWVGMPVRDAASRITMNLTGYRWSDDDVKPITSLLASGGSRPATPADVVSADAYRWRLPEAVHLALSSPYAFLR